MNRSAKIVPLVIPALFIACSGTYDQGSSGSRDSTGLAVSQASLRALPVDPSEDPLPPPPPPTRPIGTIVPPIGTIVPPIGTIFQPPVLPPDSDLRPDGAMRYYGGGATWGLQIDVVNIGTTPATGTTGRVSIGPYTFTGSLYRYYIPNATPLPPNTVGPRERGYIKVDIQPNLLSPCGAYPVQIDLDHTMQAGANPFANDSRSVLAYQTGIACRLTWYRPINGATLGHEPDPASAGKSLRDIVSSVEIGRADGNRCSACHHSTSTFPYHPTVAAGAASNPLIDPFQPISGTEAWLGTSNPWLPRFLELPESGTASAKPAHLKDAFRKWLLDGAIK
jgi:hypothetical protein